MTAYLGISNVSLSLLGIHYMFRGEHTSERLLGYWLQAQTGTHVCLWCGSGPHTEPELVGIQKAVGLRSPMVRVSRVWNASPLQGDQKPPPNYLALQAVCSVKLEAANKLFLDNTPLTGC